MASIFDTDDASKLSSVWARFLSQPAVNCPVALLSDFAGAKPNLTCNSSRFWDLEFNSTADNDEFHKSDYNAGGGVILGLASDQFLSASTKLEDVFKQFGLGQDSKNQWASGGLVDTIITALASGLLSLNIDTVAGARNMMWLTPGQTLRHDTALCFVPALDGPTSLNSIKTAILSAFSLETLGSISNPKIFLQRTCYGIDYVSWDGSSVWDISSTYRLTFRITFGNLWFWLSLEPTGMSLSATPNGDLKKPPSLWKELDSLNPTGLKGTDALPALEGVLDNITLLNLSAGKYEGSGIWWRGTMSLTWGRSDSKTSNKAPMQIFLSYNSLSSAFSGGLITAQFYASEMDKLLPTYVPGRDIDAPVDHTVDPPKVYIPPDSWDIMQLCGETDDLPKGLPTSIAVAEITYQRANPSVPNDSGWLSLLAKLVAPKANSDAEIYVPMPIEWNELEIELYKGSGFGFRGATFFTLTDQSGRKYPEAQLGLTVIYDSAASTGSTFQVRGYVDNLYLGLLGQFFHLDYRAPLLATLGKLEIASLQVMYTYHTGQASSFCFTGIIVLGPLQLRMFYQYASSVAESNTAAHTMLPDDGPKPQTVTVAQDGKPRSDWFFECDLEASSAGATIGSIVTAISDDAAGSLPSFVYSISIPTTGGRNPVSIRIAKTESGQILFVLRIVIEEFTVTFVQVSPKDGTNTKRLLRFAVDKIPLIDKIPLLDSLPQPFDQLEYYWVNGTSGFSRSEVEAFKKENLLDGEDTLLYKESTGSNTDEDTGAPVGVPDPNTIVIQSGHHFVVVQKGKVEIDHVFNATPVPAPPSPAPAPEPANLALRSAEISTPNPSTPTKGRVVFKLGPLSITAVTLQYKEQGMGSQKILSIVLDATFIMGPMSFSLLGFSLGVPLSGDITLNNLAHLASEIVVGIQGLALSFSSPPLLIAGGFEHQVVADGEIYLGGLGVGWPPYTFVGLGEYEVLNSYKSVFIYAKLDGPLVELEFATISGVRLGFGYNSMVRSPALEQITTFPFIDDTGASGAGNDPMAILKSMVQSPADLPWVSAKQNSFWLAAGMTVTAFDILSVTAVAMFAFRDSGPVISLYADAVAQMPPAVKDRTFMIVYVEIGLVAEMNFVDGYFQVEAALAPTSFLLVPQCHIGGSFALVYWFMPNAHAGDWVCSIGGYHKKYTPPAWYPVPQRIEVSFNIGILKITGLAYFAVTPKAAMGGALIHVSLAFGPISAWLDAAMDALVNFHPLHYIADFSISVGVRFNLDCCFIHKHISASVGAWLHIEGPEFGGHARVDFWLLAFTVDFGATNKAPDPLNLLEFWEMLHKPGPQSTPLEEGADPDPLRGFLSFDEKDSKGKSISKSLPMSVPEDGAALKFSLSDGNYPMPTPPPPAKPTPATSTGAGAKWFVRGGSFSFLLATDFAMSSAVVNGPSTKETVRISAPSTQSIYSRPMRVTQAIASTLTITIHEKDSPFTVIGSWKSVKFVIKPVPRAAWGCYSRSLDPLFTRNPPSLLNGNNPNTPLAMAVSISAPPPQLAVSTIPVFSATAASKFGVLDFRPPNSVTGTNWIMAPPPPTQTLYITASLTAAENALIASDDLNALWEERQQTWQDVVAKQDVVAENPDGTLSVNQTTQLISGFADLLGWGVGRPQKEVVESPPVWALSGKAPVKLIKNMKNTYLALPRIAVVY